MNSDLSHICDLGKGKIYDSDSRSLGFTVWVVVYRYGFF